MPVGASARAVVRAASASEPELRLGQRVGADQLAAGEPRQIPRLLLGGAEVDDRQRADRGVRAERSGKRRD